MERIDQHPARCADAEGCRQVSIDGLPFEAEPRPGQRLRARLIGVNTAILSRSGGSNGIGFAVPANLVARVIDAAKAGAETLSRPWLGLEGQPVDGDLAAALGIGTPRGVLIDAL
ncbi:MAG: hypothetical protein AAFX62_12200, partial [Pseudomonadota bacterium]